MTQDFLFSSPKEKKSQYKQKLYKNWAKKDKK